MRNHFMPHGANETVGLANQKHKEPGLRPGRNSMENQTRGYTRKTAAKGIGRSEGTGRLLFYRDENDGSDHIL